MNDIDSTSVIHMKSPSNMEIPCNIITNSYEKQNQEINEKLR